MSEFDIIRQYFTHPNHDPAVKIGIGDDGAALSVPQGYDLVVATDTLVSGRHFFPDADPSLLGHKALAVNLSDLAAMGAKPAWFSLNLTLPANNAAWLSAFSQGLFKLATEHQCTLIGGDTTAGPLNIGITVFGLIKHDMTITRSGAKAGDGIFVTGTVGDAAAGLQQLLDKAKQPSPFLLGRLHQPTPRLHFAQALAGIANACIDISDGLIQDLGHILQKSQCGASLQSCQLPLSAALKNYSPDQAHFYALTGGDDYELLFTAPNHQHSALTRLSQDTKTPITQIGVITDTSHGYLIDDLEVSFFCKKHALKKGFNHF